MRALKLLLGWVLFSLALLDLHADLYSYKGESLVGTEGGYTLLFTQESKSDSSMELQKREIVGAGIKIGAQTKDYRLFIALEGYDAKGFNYLLRYGASLQYLFNFTKYTNFFVGVEAGMVDASITLDTESFTRTLFDPYYGGTLGFNIHLGKFADFELGGRFIGSNAQNSKEGKIFGIDRLFSGYFGIIIRYELDR